MIRKIHRSIYQYFVKRIEAKLFSKWKQQEEDLRKKHLLHSQGPHFKLYWAAMKDIVERKQEKEYQDKLAKIEWLKPKE